MSDDLETALEVEIVAQDLIRLAERLRDRSVQSSTRTASAVPVVQASSRKRRDAGETYVSLARSIYQARRRRAEHWPAELFGEAAWDIMLDLYIRTYEDRDVSVTSSGIASGVPLSTALRWLNLLENRGFIERHNAAHDSRVHYVRLSNEGARRMQRFLRQIDAGHLEKTEPFLLSAK